jgi:haloalkane dehalogenase
MSPGRGRKNLQVSLALLGHSVAMTRRDTQDRRPAASSTVLDRRDLLLAGTALASGALLGCASGSKERADAPSDRESSARWNADRRFAQTRAGRIAYVERGSGSPALFIHGFPLNGFQWRGIMTRLESSRRCLAPDLLGLGFTEVAPGQPVAPADQVTMLLELLDQRSMPVFDVVANDSGGAVAQLLVAHHPGRVRSILLTNCDVETECPPAAVLPVIEMAKAGTYVERWLAPWLADGALARSKDGLGGMTFSFSSHPTDEALEMYLGPLVRTARGQAQVNAYAIALEANALAGVEPLLRRTRVAARIVWGTADTIFSAENPGYLARVLPGCRGVKNVPGARLFFPEEFPDLLADEARGLWDTPQARELSEAHRPRRRHSATSRSASSTSEVQPVW